MNFTTALPINHLPGVQVIEELIRRWMPARTKGSVSLVAAHTWPGYLQIRFDGTRGEVNTLAISAPFRESLLHNGVTAQPVLTLAQDFLREIEPE